MASADDIFNDALKSSSAHDIFNEADKGKGPSIAEPDPIKVGQGEAIARGIGQGTTFGFSDEIMAGGKALLNPDEQSFRDRYAKFKAEEQAREDAASEQNPFSYHGSEFASGMLLPLGAIGTAAKEASIAQKALHGAKIGAGFGAITGMGKADKHLNMGNTLEEGLSGGVVGGALGGSLSALGHGTKNLLGKFGKGSSILAKPARSAELGLEGELLDFQKINDELYSTIEKFGTDDIQGSFNSIKRKMDAALAKAESSGEPVNTQELLSYVDELKAGLDSIKVPKAREEVTRVITMAEDYLLGKESSKVVPSLKPGKIVQPTETKIISQGEVPAVPSSMAQLEDDAARLRATEGHFNSELDYSPKEFTDPKTGKKFQQVIKTSNETSGPVGRALEPSGEIGAYTKVKPVEVNAPGEYQELIPSEKKIMARSGEPTKIGDVKRLETDIGGLRNKGYFKEPEGEVSALKLDQLTTSTVDKAVPEYSPLRETFHELKKSVEGLGIPDNMPLFISGGGNIQGEASNQIINPDVVKLIARKFTFGREVGIEETAQLNKLQAVLNNLKSAGVQNIDETIAKLQGLGERYNLGQTASEASTLPINPATGTFAGGLKTISGAANYAGYIGSRVLPIASTSIETGARLNSDIRNIPKQLAEGTKSPEHKISISRDIYNLSPEQYKQVSEVLKQDPSTAYIAKQVDNALATGDRMKRDQAMFLIKSNKTAKELLGVE